MNGAIHTEEEKWKGSEEGWNLLGSLKRIETFGCNTRSSRESSET